MKPSQSSRVRTYGVAVLSVVVAILPRLLGWSVLEEEAPFLFFFPALAFAAWYGGFGPGALASALGTVFVAHYFYPPISATRALLGPHILYLGIFLSTGTVISWLIEKLHEARQTAFDTAQEVEARAAEAIEGKRILDALLTYIPEGFAITDIPDGKIWRVSDYWCKITGYERGVLEGSTLESLFDRRNQSRDAKGADPRGMALVPLIQAVRGGQDVSAQEWSLRRADGGSLAVLCSAGPVCDSDGSAIKGVITWADISHRKRSEEELRQAYATLELRVQDRTAELASLNRQLAAEKTKLACILAAMPDAVYIVNRDYEIEYANTAMERQFGPSAGLKCHSYLYDRSDPCPWCRNEEIFSGQSLEAETYSPRTMNVYETYDTPFPNFDGTVSKLKVLRDITERKRREVERAREQKQLASLWKVGRNTELPLEEFYDLVLREILAMTGSQNGFLGFMNQDESVMTVHARSNDPIQDGSVPPKSRQFPVSAGGGLGGRSPHPESAYRQRLRQGRSRPARLPGWSLQF